MPMPEEKITRALAALKGLKRSEWARIRHAVDRAFEAQVAELADQTTLEDAAAIMRSIRREVEVTETIHEATEKRDSA